MNRISSPFNPMKISWVCILRYLLFADRTWLWIRFREWIFGWAWARGRGLSKRDLYPVTLESGRNCRFPPRQCKTTRSQLVQCSRSLIKIREFTGGLGWTRAQFWYTTAGRWSPERSVDKANAANFPHYWI